MTRHDDIIRFRHMLDHAQEAVKIAGEHSRKDLDIDRMLELSLVRLLEIVGEAATRVSSSSRERYSEIPWQQIAGMRNRLIHGYDEVDLDVLWDTIKNDLPPLIERLNMMV